MTAWITNGLLTREGHGVYRINEASTALRTARLRRAHEALMRDPSACRSQQKSKIIKPFG